MTFKGSKYMAIGLLIEAMLISCLSLSVTASAQVSGATLSGTVTDASGGVIPNGQISIKNVETAVTRNITTDTAGFYTVPNLVPGSYEITVTAPGFKTMVRSGVTLTVGAEQSLNLTMQVGQISQQVVVTEEAPTVQLSSSSIGSLVPAETVVELPLNGRDWAQLTNLNPGVSAIQTQVANGATAPRGNRGFGNEMTIAGTRPQMNNYRLDGISIVDYSGGSPASVLAQTLGVDAIAEFSVVTSNHSAEYGRTSGGVINAITKSGTNQLHGDAYWFLRDEGLDGRGAFDPPTPLPFHRNQFGASVGGPIQKDKMFFFANYEGFRQAQSNAVSSKVPTQDARNGLLTFSNSAQFPGGCAMVSSTTCQVTVSSTVKPFLPFWPSLPATIHGNTGTIVEGVENDGNEDFVTSKIDRKFSDKDSLAGSFFYDNALNGQADPPPTVFNANTSRRIMITVEETHIFTPALVNAFRVGYSRDFPTQNNPIRAILPLAADTSGIVSTLPGKAAPAISVSGLAPFKGGLGEASINTQIWNSYQLYDDAFLTKGVHSLKFGFAAENMRHGPLNLVAQNGSWGFGSLAAFLTDGAPNAASNAGPSLRPGLRQTILGGYIQDDWRFRPNLTLNLGLRYEMATVISEEKGRTAALHVITDQQPFCDTFLPGCAPGGGNPAFNNPTLHNFEPRVGFAWDPFHDGKTSVRAAFGMFDVLPLSYEFFVTWSTYPYANPRIQIPANQLIAGDFPNVTAAIHRLGLTGNGQTSAILIEHNPPRSYVMVWNLSVQRQLSASTSVTLGFVGNRGVHLFIPSDSLDMVVPQTTSAGLLWPGGITAGGKSLIGSGNLPNPNPLIATIGGATWNTDAYYDALEAQISKRMSHGFQVQASYTFGKNIDTGSGATISDQYQNSIAALPWFCTRCSRGLSDFDIKHKLTVNYIWDIPAPKLGGTFGSHVLGGWEVGGIINAQSGTPLTLLISGDPQGLNTTSASILVTPNQVPGCNPVAPNYRTTLQYVNLSCFTLPTATPAIASQCTPFGYVSPSSPGIAGTCANLLGNAGRNTLIGPGLFDFDFSVYKNNRFPKISENFNAQFRVEFFNVLNHPSFQAPVDTNYLYNQDGTPTGGGQLDTVTVPGREIQLALKLIF